jgi:hypothetical protein
MAMAHINNTFPYEGLKIVYVLFATSSSPMFLLIQCLFNTFVGKGLTQFQDITSQQLHHHTLSFLISHQTPIKLMPFYAWKMAQIVIPLFYLPLAIVSIAF